MSKKNRNHSAQFKFRSRLVWMPNPRQGSTNQGREANQGGSAEEGGGRMGGGGRDCVIKTRTHTSERWLEIERKPDTNC